MNFIGDDLFPLSKFLVINQTRKLGLTLNDILIVNAQDELTAGYYDPEKKNICLNIGALIKPETILRYSIPTELHIADMDEQTKKARLGAAVLFEECYHAAHHGTELNTEELATKYGVIQANKLPIEILTTTREAKETEMDTEIPIEQLQEKVVIPLTEGGMFDFIKEVSKKGEMNTIVPTRFGTMEIINNEHITMVRHKTNVTELDKVKEHIGHLTRLAIEYAGMIYTHENGNWKTVVDVDYERMAETDIARPTEVHLTKIEGQQPLIELRR